MFQTIVILILIVIVVYLILDKKNIKLNDVKIFFKNTAIKTKEKSHILGKKIMAFFYSTREKLKIQSEKIKQRRAEEKIKREFESRKREQFHQNASFTEEENAMKNDDGVKMVEKVKIVRRGGFFSTLLFIVLIVCVGLFAYKKIMLDFDGTYATDRLTYSDEYGFCMLITYYPNYQKGNAKGFAITHIPFGALFTEIVQANKYGNDTADSKDMLDTYQLLASYGDNDLVDYFAKTLSDSGISTKSIDIGNHGKYFVLSAKYMGYENPYY